MRFATMLTVALVVVSLGIVTAVADTVSLEASANAFGVNGAPDANFPSTNGYGDVMFTRHIDGGDITKFWVKFDLSKIQGTATSATLKLTNADANGSDPIHVAALKDGDVGEGWGETTLTYNNAPGNVLGAIGFNVGSGGNMTDLGYFSSAGGSGSVITVTGVDWRSADLLAAVNADTNGSLTLGFSKHGYDGDGAIFASRTAAFYAGPTLVLTGVTVPEPSTLILLCTGLAGLLAYAWRKRK